MLVDLSSVLEKKNKFTLYAYTKKNAHKCEGMEIPWNVGAFVMEGEKVVFIGTFWAAQGYFQGIKEVTINY